MKYRFIYKTTNIVNGRYYIGKHTTEDLNDGYLGSGTDIKKAIKKYGRENFSREILEFCDDDETLDLAESKIVTQELLDNDPLIYNRVPGGGGCSRPGEKNNFFGKTHTAETRKMLSENAKSRTGEKNHFYGKKHTDDAKRKMSVQRLGKNRKNDLMMHQRMLKRFVGWYILPDACFMTSRDAAEHCGITSSAVIKWCVTNNEKLVSDNYQIPSKYHGRTWKENGFGFIKKEDLGKK